jgi:hypothetical protein
MFPQAVAIATRGWWQSAFEIMSGREKTACTAELQAKPPEAQRARLVEAGMRNSGSCRLL